MKIVYCINSLDNYGGIERVLIDRANYLVENYNYDITIITSEIEKKESFFELNSKVKIINLNIDYYELLKKNISENKLLNIMFFIKKIIIKALKEKVHLKKLQIEIKKINPDVVVSMGDLSRNVVGKLKINVKKILENHFNKGFIMGEDIENKFFRFLKIKIKTIMERKNLKNYDNFMVLTREDKKKWGGYTEIIKKK